MVTVERLAHVGARAQENRPLVFSEMAASSALVAAVIGDGAAATTWLLCQHCHAACASFIVAAGRPAGRRAAGQ